VRGRAESVDDREDLVLQHELPDDLLGVGGVVPVVEELVRDLATVHATGRVDGIEVRLGGRRDLGVSGRGRTGERLMRAHQNLGVGHTGYGLARGRAGALVAATASSDEDGGDKEHGGKTAVHTNVHHLSYGRRRARTHAPVLRRKP
jgi:hypothetical protein